MRSNNHHLLQQKSPCFKSKNLQVYATSSRRGAPGDIDMSPGDVSMLGGYGSKAFSGDPQQGLAESDEWSVESPAKESGYHSEESSLGQSAEMPSSKLHVSHDCELHGFLAVT